jgi:hypothetical protein
MLLPEIPESVTPYFLLENPPRSGWLQMKLSPMQME